MTIDEFALWVANTEATAAPSTSNYDDLPHYNRHTFEELASSLTNAGHFFLVMTAGTDPQLRRDIQELAEVAKAAACEQAYDSWLSRPGGNKESYGLPLAYVTS